MHLYTRKNAINPIMIMIMIMNLFAFVAANKYLNPYQTTRILAPTDQLCAHEAHRLVLIRPNKVHLISTGDVYKRNLSKESYFTPSTSPPWAIDRIR